MATTKQTVSRTPSPVPSAMLSSESHRVTQSSPHLPLPQQRRSSFSDMNECLQKPLVSQRSFPHLNSKQRRPSDTSHSDHSLTSNEITRYANQKRNHDFHTLFRSVPDHERLIDDYGCALQKEILLQGRVYISEHHLCFNANIFGWITNLVIAFTDIEAIEKKSTAFFIPNAILISTQTSKHFLASFLSRDQAFDQMVDIWKASRSQKKDIHHHFKADDDDVSTFSEDDFSSYSSDGSVENTMPILNAKEEDRHLPLPKPILPLEDPPADTNQLNPTTECDCAKNDQHFPSVVHDSTYPTTLDTLYQLLYHSPFMTTFLTEIEKSTDVCIGEWKEQEGITCRESSYVKYLGGAIGPKTTKCYLTEEMLHVDTGNYISQLTTTRTPDVPSGGSFSVKTRTCLSWSGQGQVRVLVTVLVEFTKSSWLKSTIEKATLDGQQSYYKSLDKALRQHLDQSKPKNHRRSHRRRRHVPEHPQKETQSVDHVRIPTTSQLIGFCMAIMVLTNVYIAFKMAGVNRQLAHLGRAKQTTKDAVWQLLGKLDPDQPYHQDPSWVYARQTKSQLDQQMLELEKMMLHVGQNMEQVTHVIRDQQKRLLQK
ncbi:GRAM domain-containing protein [Choanephora cucurbitarum]|nr:GRAM domain-containing protein [Choanephora cucurbitarum]